MEGRQDPATGHRFTAAGVPVCVHPERVGLPAAPYASDGLPLPWETPPPAEAGEVPARVRQVLTAAPPEACDKVIQQATEILHAADATPAARLKKVQVAIGPAC
ncbi:hypothetical protein ACFY0A_36130 [Streptomyces sp. NPDC001698]|uniref:hypothetical protein n=1 Tax=Streptomyces sp. NPDC001698 TaxID=3364601 RepID=UPI0036AF9F5A